MSSAKLPIFTIRDDVLNADRFMATAQKNFARNLDRLLREKRVTKQKLAKEIGVSGATITHWIEGRSSPLLSRLEPIARKLGVTVSQLLQDDDDAPMKPRQVDALLTKIAKIDAMLEELAEARGYELKRKRG